MPPPPNLISQSTRDFYMVHPLYPKQQNTDLDHTGPQLLCFLLPHRVAVEKCPHICKEASLSRTKPILDEG